MSNLIKELLTDSKFNMWRATMAVIHLDGKVTQEEREWATKKISDLPFDNDQRTILTKDLESGLNIEDVLEKITDKKDLAFLLHMTRVIGNLDGDFSAEEKLAWKELNGKIMKNLDIPAIEKSVQKAELESYHEDNVFSVNNKSSLFESAFKSFMKFLNPGDYRKP